MNLPSSDPTSFVKPTVQAARFRSLKDLGPKDRLVAFCSRFQYIAARSGWHKITGMAGAITSSPGTVERFFIEPYLKAVRLLNLVSILIYEIVTRDTRISATLYQ